MNLTTPITITFTKQEVLDFQHDRVNNFIRVKVALITADGVQQIHDVVIDKMTAPAVPGVAEVPAEVDAEGFVVKGAVPARTAKPAKGGAIQRVVVNSNPSPATNGIAPLFRVETVQTGSNDAYQNAMQALRQNDDDEEKEHKKKLAALTAAGIADGWLMPGMP